MKKIDHESGEVAHLAEGSLLLQLLQCYRKQQPLARFLCTCDMCLTCFVTLVFERGSREPCNDSELMLLWGSAY